MNTQEDILLGGVYTLLITPDLTGSFKYRQFYLSLSKDTHQDKINKHVYWNNNESNRYRGSDIRVAFRDILTKTPNKT